MLDSDDDSGTGDNARLQYRVSTTGLYHVAVASQDTGVGSYRVSYKLDDYAGEEDSGSGIETEGTLSVGGTVRSAIDDGGDVLRNPDTPAGENGLHLTLRDVSGDIIDSTSDGSFTLERDQITYSGKYYIEVADPTTIASRNYRLSAGQRGGGLFD